MKLIFVGSISPFAVGFGNVTVNDNPLVKSDHRGVEVLVGSSRSRLALNIATTLNITIVSDGPKICNLTKPDGLQCVGWRGGLYSTSDSTSWELEDNTIPFNGSAENPGYDAVNGEEYQGSIEGKSLLPVLIKLAGLDEDPFSPFPRGWDTFSFPAGDKNVDMPYYPFTTIDNASFPFGQGMLGGYIDCALRRSHADPSRPGVRFSLPRYRRRHQQDTYTRLGARLWHDWRLRGGRACIWRLQPRENGHDASAEL
jgi:hypothetical protein